MSDLDALEQRLVNIQKWLCTQFCVGRRANVHFDSCIELEDDLLALCARVRKAEGDHIAFAEDIADLKAQLQQVRDALRGLLTVANAHDCWGDEVKAAQDALAASGGTG